MLSDLSELHLGSKQALCSVSSDAAICIPVDGSRDMQMVASPVFAPIGASPSTYINAGHEWPCCRHLVLGICGG